jgi:hypothetical protein
VAPVLPADPPPDGVSIRYAAAILDRPREQIEALVRRSNVVPLYGSRGRGGTLRIARADLPMLDVAAMLDDVRVPRTELATIVRDLAGRTDLHGARAAIVVRPYGRHLFAEATSDVRELIGEGAIVAFADVATITATLAARARTLVEPLARGRARGTRDAF